MIDLKPTLVLIDVLCDEMIPPEPSRSRSPSPYSYLPLEERPDSSGDDDADAVPECEAHGLKLLGRVVSEARLRNLSRLVVPIPVIRPPLANGYANCETAGLQNRRRRSAFYPNRRLVKRCLDLGATDVITSPMTEKTIVNLGIQAYRAHRDAAKEQQAMLEVRRGRKRSWVGVDEEKPFAYLREAMVSGLMNGICRLDGESENKARGVRIDVSSRRKALVKAAVGNWHFCAQSFSEDELILAARVMFKHALKIPELERWRIPTGMPCCFPCPPFAIDLDRADVLHAQTN